MLSNQTHLSFCKVYGVFGTARAQNNFLSSICNPRSSAYGITNFLRKMACFFFLMFKAVVCSSLTLW